jgi:hypothetical protein
MATGSRTLKLSILGDVSDLNKSLKTADKEVQGFGDKISKFGKIAAAGFLVAGAAATKFAVDAVKNAAADEAAQRTLAKTIENTTGATQKQISAVEDWITTTSLAKGVTDDVIRPAFARLTRSTKDVEESQKLLNLALDISSATGKPLETISNSLGKAYDGNTAALGRLGLGLDQSIIKSGDFDAVYTSLRGTFKGFAEQEANTFEGKLRRLQIAFDEGKETIGSYILTAITPLVTLTVNNLIPALQNIADKIGKAVQPAFEKIQEFIRIFVIPIFGALKDAFNTVRDAFEDNADKLEPLITLFKDLYAFIAKFVVPIIKVTLVTAIQAAGQAIGLVLDFISPIIEKIAAGIRTTVNLAIDGINALIKAYNFANGLWGGADVALVSKLGEGAATKLSAGLYGSTPVNTGGASGASGATSGVTLGETNVPTITSTAKTAMANSNDKALANIAKLQKDVDRNKAAADKLLIAAQAASMKAESFLPESNLAIFKELQTRGTIPSNAGGGGLQNIYNVTVNGAINSEQTSRQIIDILNQSQARGTLGASGLVGAVNF